jgi:hypothetical protein
LRTVAAARIQWAAFDPNGRIDCTLTARYVTDGEWQDLRTVLPREFAHLLPV